MGSENVENDKKTIYRKRNSNSIKYLYVKSVSQKGITYTEEFKHIFIEENEKGKLPRNIFEECGFDIDMIGMKRVMSSGSRWRAAYRKNGVLGLRDTRIESAGRTLERELTLEEKYARLEAERNLLKAENELLKKIKLMEGRMRRK
ncbi:putative transposase [Bacillus thuringiensis serovar kurstaki str. HD73]|nr:putative transposase [Bacillus thuringiensis serovar kurstaki str. HD73]